MICTFIIFGITGDLSKRKLIPGLYRLIAEKKIDNFIIVGTGLEESTIDQALMPAKEFINDFHEEVWQQLIANAVYQKLDIQNSQHFEQLKQEIYTREQQYDEPSNRLAYCAVASAFFVPITQALVQVGLFERQQPGTRPWQRIAYEKPFGSNHATAVQMNNALLALLEESQIYRVDHYLAKEVVENITYIRFTNHVFEALWNNQHIDSVQIVLNEQLGVESRGAYYDQYGALSDVVQNHMLQLLALVAMDSPKQLTGDYIRDCKAAILRQTRVTDGFLGQYKGYLTEKHVAATSTTETLAVLRLEIDDPRWQGVPFYLRTGKYMPTKETKIHIRFKQVACRLLQGCPLTPNYLTIVVFPDGGIFFEVNVKKPGMRDEVMPVAMDFCYACLTSTPEAYELILQDILLGERAVSVRTDEIESSWHIIDQVRAMQLPLHIYEQDSMGPQEALKAFAHNYTIEWK